MVKIKFVWLCVKEIVKVSCFLVGFVNLMLFWIRLVIMWFICVGFIWMYKVLVGSIEVIMSFCFKWYFLRICVIKWVKLVFFIVKIVWFRFNLEYKNNFLIKLLRFKFFLWMIVK